MGDGAGGHGSFVCFMKKNVWTIHSFIHKFEEFIKASDSIETEIKSSISLDPATDAYDSSLTLRQNYKKIAKWKIVPDGDSDDYFTNSEIKRWIRSGWSNVMIVNAMETVLCLDLENYLNMLRK